MSWGPGVLGSLVNFDQHEQGIGTCTGHSVYSWSTVRKVPGSLVKVLGSLIKSWGPWSMDQKFKEIQEIRHETNTVGRQRGRPKAVRSTQGETQTETQRERHSETERFREMSLFSCQDDRDIAELRR